MVCLHKINRFNYLPFNWPDGMLVYYKLKVYMIKTEFIIDAKDVDDD